MRRCWLILAILSAAGPAAAQRVDNMGRNHLGVREPNDHLYPVRERFAGRCGAFAANRVRFRRPDDDSDSIGYVNYELYPSTPTPAQRARGEPMPGIGYFARGIGSPFHGSELESSLAGSSVGSRFQFATALDYRIALYTIPSPDVRRVCLTAGAHVHLFSAHFDPEEATAGNAALRVGILARTPWDGTRLHIEGEVAFPSIDPRSEPRRLQIGLSSALTLAVDDELRYLYPLQWGGRVITTFDVRIGERDAPEIGGYLRLRIALGYARLASTGGDIEGLTGGVRLRLLFGGRHTETFSFRAGVRAAVSVGSMWPTDVLFPFQFDGLLEFGWPHFVLNVWGGPMWLRFIDDLGIELYARAGLSLTAFFHVSPANPLPIQIR